MRSRYSAYTLRDDAYLQRSWHASTRPQGPLADAESQWIGLELKRHTQDGDTAIVEFIARYKRNGRAHRMHEVSRFVREEGQWLYVEAIDG